MRGYARGLAQPGERLSQELEAALKQRDRLAQDVARLQMEADAAVASNRRLEQQLQAARSPGDATAPSGGSEGQAVRSAERRELEDVRRRHKDEVTLPGVLLLSCAAGVGAVRGGLSGRG